MGLLKGLSLEQQDTRFREALKAIPMKNSKAVVLSRDEKLGEIEIRVELVYNGFIMNFLSRLLKPNKYKRYILEGVGKDVYEMIDNKSTFEELIDKFAEEHKLTFIESRALLGQYMQLLTRRGIVIPMVPREKRGV